MVESAARLTKFGRPRNLAAAGAQKGDPLDVLGHSFGTRIWLYTVAKETVERKWRKDWWD